VAQNRGSKQTADPKGGRVIIGGGTGKGRVGEDHVGRDSCCSGVKEG